jgi:FkbM family methyltransferase
VKRDLIYDVGVHIGEDAAYYLHKGYRVVGVEANPAMVARLQDRFEEEIRAGRLTLVAAGIAESAGELDFYVCEDKSEWSSFELSVASRDGARHHTVKVRAQRFATILAEHGEPWYCKIDIEGHDRLCLEGLQEAGQRPPYVSLEMAFEHAGVDIGMLLDMGYRRFKIVSQSARSQPLPLLATVNGWLPKSLSKGFRGLDRELRGKRRDGDWRFPRGSSGPFGDDIPGPWRGHDEVIRLWGHLRKVAEQSRPGGGSDWYDIHATVAA